MKHLSNPFRLFVIIFCSFMLVSCGYTTTTNLPDHIRSINVVKVENMIDITGEVTNQKGFKVYRPGLEVEVRNNLIERFIFDGYLKIVRSDTADAVLKAQLIEFRRDPLRYNADESIQEFRVSVVIKAELIDQVEGLTLWGPQQLDGNASYFLTGELATSEDEAVDEALVDLSRKLVESVLEVW